MEVILILIFIVLILLCLKSNKVIEGLDDNCKDIAAAGEQNQNDKIQIDGLLKLQATNQKNLDSLSKMIDDLLDKQNKTLDQCKQASDSTAKTQSDFSKPNDQATSLLSQANSSI